jgi:adenine-specific DNA-methyltransferase
VRLQDFLDVRSLPRRTSIISNPPYIRHHRLSSMLKGRLRHLSVKTLGQALDGRTGFHAFFLIHALTLLEKGQRLAFIVPADTCEGVYAQRLWSWIGREFRIHGIVTFAPEATPFPGVDTNAVILLLSRDQPLSQYNLVRVQSSGTQSLQRWVKDSSFRADDITVYPVDVAPALRAGVSRTPFSYGQSEEITLGDLVYTIRGVATGANDFFCLTSRQIADRGLPPELFVRTVLRTRDVPTDRLTLADLDRLDAESRPTFLLNLGRTPERELPLSVQQYLQQGVSLGLPQRALIAQRRPWYKMEQRRPPAFLFAYLGRRNSRFIVNEAGVVPATSFLCVYPQEEVGRKNADALANLLADPELFVGLAFVAKSYGGGAFKVEPRSLEKLPLGESIQQRYPWVRDVAASRRLVFRNIAI